MYIIMLKIKKVDNLSRGATVLIYFIIFFCGNEMKLFKMLIKTLKQLILTAR